MSLVSGVQALTSLREFLILLAVTDLALSSGAQTDLFYSIIEVSVVTVTFNFQEVKFTTFFSRVT
jgi:hypothetical protein